MRQCLKNSFGTQTVRAAPTEVAVSNNVGVLLSTVYVGSDCPLGCLCDKRELMEG